MTTLGDLLHTTKQFFSLDRTPEYKVPERISRLQDSPMSGRFATWHQWDDEKKERLALHSSWAYSAIRTITMAALASKLEVWRRIGNEESEPIVNHPLEVLFASPSNDFSREQLWWHTHFSLQLSGKSFWLMYPDNAGNIAELFPLPHHKINPVPDESPNPDSLFSHYIYLADGRKEIVIPRDNVVYLRFIDPFDPYGALSPLKAASRAMVLDLSQTSWATRTFDEEGGLPANIISVAEGIDDEDLKALRLDMRRNIGKNLIVPAGTLNVERLGMTNEEADFLASREFSKDEIYEVFGVPAGNRTETGVKEANRRLVTHTVWPILKYLAGIITNQMSKPLFGPDVFCQFEDIRPQDRALAVQEATQYWPVFSVNEARKERGMDDLPARVVELDEGESVNLWQDVPIKALPDFLALLGASPLLPDTATMTEPTGAPSMLDSASPMALQAIEDQQTQVEPEAVEAEPEPAMMSLPSHFEQWQDLAVKVARRGNVPCKAFEHPRITTESSITLATVLGLCQSPEEVKGVFGHLDDYLNIKRLVGGDGTVSPERLAMEDQFSQEAEEFLTEQADRVFAQIEISQEPPDSEWWKQEEVLLLAFLLPFLERWAEEGISLAAIALAEVGLGLSAGANAEAAIWAGKQAKVLAKGLIATSKELVKTRFANWKLTKKPLTDLKNILRKTIAPTWRATLIAQTEITRALSNGFELAAGLVQGVKSMVWITEKDEKVCPICRPVHGERRRVGKTFSNGLDGPPAHPRCRCELAYEV